MTTKEKLTIESLSKEFKQLKEIWTSKRNKMEVVVAGDVKAGKSTLINALFKDDKLCETGVVRTTTDNKIIESEHYFIIDTPGINANDEDTEVAEFGYDKADFFIFTHNIIDGELLAKEVEFLNEIRLYFKDDSQFVRNTFVILTNAHQLDDEDLAVAMEKIQKQIKTMIGFNMQLFVVDSVSYLNAYLENKQLLMESSGIPKLQLALIHSAKKFNENAVKERCEILDVKKVGFLKRIEHLEKDQTADLVELQSGTVDFNEMKSLLKELEEYPNKVKGMLNDLEKVDRNFWAHVDISAGKLFPTAHKIACKSSNRATAEGLGVLRDYVMPKVEKAYIKTRREIISYYRDLLPNFNGADSVVTKAQRNIEIQLAEFKTKLIPVADLLDMKEFANVKTTLDVPLVNNDSAVFQHSSSLYASEFENCYDVESASWYELWIEVVETNTYKRGLFGEKLVDVYGYNIYPAYEEVSKHLDTSIKDAHSIVKSAYQKLCEKYSQRIQSEVTSIINDWVKILASEVKRENTLNQQITEKVGRIKQQLKQLDQLKEELKSL